MANKVRFDKITGSTCEKISNKAFYEDVLSNPDVDLLPYVSSTSTNPESRRIYVPISAAIRSTLTTSTIIYVQFRCTTADAAGSVYTQSPQTTIKSLSWTLLPDGYYYSQLVPVSFSATQLSNPSTLYVFIQVGDNITGTCYLTKAYVAGGHYTIPEIGKDVDLIKKAVKYPDIDLIPSVSGTLTNVPLGRIFIPIPSSIRATLSTSTIIYVQFKCTTADAAGSVYTQSPQITVAPIFWTHNSDGYYYSQYIPVSFSATQLSNPSTLYVFVQVGANITGTCYLTKAYVVGDYYDLQNQNNTSLINVLEIPYRGYASMTPVLVKKDRTGNFTTIQEAINSIIDASVMNQYDIQVYDDFEITDLAELWEVGTPTSANTETGTLTKPLALFTTKNWVHVRGVGKRTLSLISPTTLTAASYQYLQVIYPKGNCIIANFKVIIKGGRYAIHQEAGGSASSPDYHSTTIYKDVERIHLGNFESDGYPAGIWSSYLAQADGTTSGYKRWDVNGKFIAPHVNPFYFHSNSNFDEPTEHHFINCEITPTKAMSLSSQAAYYGDIGSGQKALIEFIGCNIPKFSITNSIRSTETDRGRCDLWENGGATLQGYGNRPMVVQDELPNVLSFEALTAGVDISVTGGTAYDDIFEDELKKYSAGSDTGAIVYGRKRIEDPNSSLGNSQIFSLPYRLGNCATIHRTLILNVGGVEYTITFDQNYMTTDGSSYSYNTTPAISRSAIITAINAIAPTVFKAYVGKRFKIYSFKDCQELGINLSGATLKIGNGVVRDPANAYNAWKLAGVGDIAEGIVGDQISNSPNGIVYPEGNILLVKKNIFPGSILGISSMTSGTLYKCAANGTFVTTTVTSEACLKALDTVYVIGI